MMTVLWGLNVWANDEAGGSSAIWVSIKTGGAWLCSDSVHLTTVKGRWDASDLVGIGGSKYFTGDDARFWLRDFKPFDLNFDQPGHRVGERGDGKWIKPWFKVSDDSLSWIIMAVRRGSATSTDLTDDDIAALTTDDMSI